MACFFLGFFTWIFLGHCCILICNGERFLIYLNLICLELVDVGKYTRTFLSVSGDVLGEVPMEESIYAPRSSTIGLRWLYNFPADGDWIEGN